jgi:hypothetical protein
MGGGLMQLVAYGAQDVYLTGNPQITFFKVVYRRHTNFAVEAIEQTFNGSVGFGKRVSCQITRNGDLITKMYLKATLKDTEAGKWVDNVGYSMIKSVELQIGGTKIDKHYGTWLNIWHELSRNHSHDNSTNAMVGGIGNTPTANVDLNLYVPLQFFCCRNDGLALPLIALQYHDVRVEFEFAALTDVVTSGHTTGSLSDASLLVDYIYLDSEERKRFAQASHEYLIEQLQYTGEEAVSGSTGKYRLNFNHPCKELVWAVTDYAEASSGITKSTNFTDKDGGGGVNPVQDAQLQLNGHDRMSKQSGNYFNFVQTRAHHSNTPSNGINVYSFALNPEEHQPSGTCNFSRIDNAQLNLSFTAATTTGKVHVFATSYNVLRIMSGMGGLAYSN